MWTSDQSEVVRILYVLRHNSATPEQLFQKFRSATRDDMKLAVAILGFFYYKDQNDDYYHFMQKKRHPLMMALIELNNVNALGYVDERNPLSEQQLNEYLHVAVSLGRIEIVAWMLALKKDRFGFHEKEYVFKERL